MIRIHYHRHDHDYGGAGLWTWDGEQDANPPEQEVLPTGTDDYGPYFDIDPAAYGEPGKPSRNIGFIPRIRHSWEYKDGSDRFWTPQLGKELWLVSGDPQIYSEPPDTTPRIQAAWIIDEHRIAVRLLHPMALGDEAECRIRIHRDGRDVYTPDKVRVRETRRGRVRLLELHLAESIPSHGKTTVEIEGYHPAHLLPAPPGDAESHDTTAAPLGADCTAARTTFRVFSPGAEGVHIILYDHREGIAGREIIALEPEDGGIWSRTVKRDLHRRFYMVFVDTDAPAAHREVVDVYTKCATGNAGRAMIVDPSRLDPPAFHPLRRPANIHHPVDAVIYEMHLRDFTISRDSGVHSKERGKYIGAARRGTTIPGTNIATCLDHLVELGVTHVQLLPIQDFDNDEVHGHYDWGYMTQNFFSPEGWYATNPQNESRVRETKEMIKAFHNAGIRVVMDVVYNHTSNHAVFDSIAPGYYYRRRPDGTHWNGSGTGNEFRSEAPLARRFIVECCRYWVEEYGVDGFRFDLMGLIDLETLETVRQELHAIDPSLLLYGEPWAATGPDGAGIRQITYKHVLRGTGIGAFNDVYRNALKGSPDGDDPGYIQSGLDSNAIKRGLMGSVHDWAEQPAEVIQYADCHDNLTLWDKLAVSCPDDPEELRIRMQALAIGLLAVSQGIMFLHGGTEFARTKGGNHNSYDAPDHVNQFVWSRKARSPELFRYTKAMIALRRAHPVFRLADRQTIERRLRFLEELRPDPRTIVMHLDGAQLDGETWTECLVLVNPTRKDRVFNLPPGQWDVYTQGMNEAGGEPLLCAEKELPVPIKGVAVLARAGA